VYAAAQRSDDIIKVGITSNADQRVTTVFTQSCAHQVQGLLESTGQMPHTPSPVQSFVRTAVDQARGADTLVVYEEEDGSALVIEVGRQVDSALLEILSPGAAEHVRRALEQA
jgi:S-adenosylmethionine:tRNA-ribosyltransferase-isomerase (queuine synthetase)